MFRINFLLIALLACSQNVLGQNLCKNIELIEGSEIYNTLVCSGELYFSVGLYEKAIDKFLEASEIQLHDTPNYLLNTKIAHSYLLMGDLDKTDHYLEMSRITLNLLSGIYQCGEGNGKAVFHIRNGADVLETQASKEVTLKMCGGAYDYIYNSRSKNIEAIVQDGELAKYYLDVAELARIRRR